MRTEKDGEGRTVRHKPRFHRSSPCGALSTGGVWFVCGVPFPLFPLSSGVGLWIYVRMWDGLGWRWERGMRMCYMEKVSSLKETKNDGVGFGEHVVMDIGMCVR